MIVSFRCRETEKLFHEEFSKPFAALERAARRKLLMLDAAETLEELRAMPGNRLETLKGDRRGQFSIRVNDQYRICFIWSEGDAREVEIVDHH